MKTAKTLSPDYPKLVFAVLLSAYFLWIAAKPFDGSFLDVVDLAIHETGHLLFRPLGEFMMVAGGSLFQLVMPALFVGYFIWHGKHYSAAIVALWVGQSLLNVFIYANDAQVMQLVLTSGLTGSEGSFHDWNYLLTETGLLDSTPTVARLLRFSATATILAGAAAAVYYAIYPQAEKERVD